MRSAIVALMALMSMVAPVQAWSAEGGLEAVPAAPTVDPQALQLAREFLTLSSPPDLLEKHFVDQFKSMMLMVPGVQAPEGSEAARSLDSMLSTTGPAIRLHAPAVTEAYAQAYARTYSIEDLRQMVTFAASPAGQHLFARGSEIELDPGVLAAGQSMMMDAFLTFEHERKVAACKQATAKRIAAGETNAKCPLA